MGPGISEHFSGRGAVFGDYDNDGDIDVFVLNMNDPPSLLRNDEGNKQNWTRIKLGGTHCNRTAIGAGVVTGKQFKWTKSTAAQASCRSLIWLALWSGKSPDRGFHRCEMADHPEKSKSSLR